MARNWAKSIYSLLMIVAVNLNATVNAADAPQIIVEQHETAVETARNGDITGGLKLLDAVIDDFPDYYPAKRDYVIIARWAEDCETALVRFNVIRDESPLEGYLAEAVAECLRDLRQLDQAMDLLKESLLKNPDDEDAKRAMNDLREYIKQESRPTLSFRAGFNESAVGSKERQLELNYSQEITSNIRGYYRHLGMRSEEAGKIEVSRASFGLRTWFGIKYLLDTAVFTDVKTEDEEGGRINLNYYPNPLWELSIGHSSSAEDAPLRGRNVTAGITKAVSSAMATSYHSRDYRWEWSANYGYYHFSDTNVRHAYGTSLSYAYDLRDKQEQRIIFEYSQSRNSFDNAPYYNPKEDWSATINLRATHVYDTEWERVVDHFTLYTGVYNQAGFGSVNQPDYGSRNNGGARYEVELEFSNTESLSFELDYASRVYDGNNEQQTRINISYSHKL